MMNTKVLLSLFFLWSASAFADDQVQIEPIPADKIIAAASGAPVIALKDTPWCTGKTEKTGWNTEGIAFNYNYRIDYAGDFFDVQMLRKVMIFSCEGDGSDKDARLSWVQSYLQARANGTHMTLKEMTATALVFATGDESAARTLEDGGGEICKKFEVDDKANAVVKAKKRAFRAGAGCQKEGGTSWAADRGLDAFSAVETLGWLFTEFYRGGSIGALIAWTDAQNFDVDQFTAELAEQGFKGADLEHARLKYFNYRHGFETWKAKHRKELYKDFDKLTRAHEKGFKEWTQKYKAHKEAIDFAFKLEEAHTAEVHGEKMQGFEGCSTPARKYARAFIKKSKPKTLEDLKARGADPMGNLIFTALRECEKMVGNKGIASGFASLIMNAPATRGPRFYAQRNAAKMADKLKKKNSSFPYSGREVEPRAPQYGYGLVYNSGKFPGGAGVIQRVKKRGKTLQITFKKVVTRNKHYNCKSTGRAKRVRRSGRVEMYQNCSSAASTKLSRREKPIQISKEFGAGIQKGRYLTFSRPDEENPKIGFPNVVYKKRESDRIYSYYGFLLR